MLVTTLRSRIRLARNASISQQPELKSKECINASEQVSSQFYTNPLSDIIDDSTYKELLENELIDSRQLRNYQIRKTYFSLKPLMGSARAIEYLQEQHPHLQYDTIRKIIYKAA